MGKIDKRAEIKKLVDEYRIKLLDEYPQLEQVTNENAGSVFEIFLAKEIYGPKFGVTSDDELDESFDINSRGEGQIDISIKSGENELNIFEAKWKGKLNASFDRGWTSRILEIEDKISDESFINGLPSYTKDKINDFLDNKIKDKVLNVYLCTNTAPNEDQRDDFDKRTYKSSKRFKDFTLNYHLHNYASLHDEWSRVHVSTLKPLTIKKNDKLNHERFFEVADQHKSIYMIVASGTEIVDWVRQNKNIFHENIRGYKGKNIVNKELLETINYSPSEFITFNNGITASTTKITDKGEAIKFDGFQIINGCQTASTLKDYVESNYKSIPKQEKIDNLKNLRVLVKVVKVDSTASDTGTKAKLIKANNTQTAINSSDFRSTDPVQISIETHIKNDKSLQFKGNKLSYERKVRYLKRKQHHRYIKLTELAEHVYAFENDPYTIYRNTKNLYDDSISGKTIGNYWKIFGYNNSDVLRLPGSRIEQLFGICFLSTHITDEIKKIIKNEDKESFKYTLYYLKRFYISSIGHMLRKNLSSDEYNLLLLKCYKNKIFTNDNFITSINELIEHTYNAIKFVYKVACASNDDDKVVNIKNFGRQHDKYQSVIDEVNENTNIKASIDKLPLQQTIQF